MVFYLRKWIDRIKFILLFVLCTYLLYRVFMFVSEWAEPLHKYKEPSGRAVKVFRHEHASISDQGSIMDRLRLFYWYGE
jgi:hypothetical protein